MKCKEIIELIENEFPMKYAESWDNTGFQVGDREKEVSHVFVAMDVTEETIDEAIRLGANMIVTHHPMIFSPLSAITSDTLNGRRILKMIENGICYMSAHTNYDSCRMVDSLLFFDSACDEKCCGNTSLLGIHTANITAFAF